MAIIELVNINHSYEEAESKKKKKKVECMNDFAMDDMNITFEDGSANALLGPSGCGKTTLLNIISGLLTPTQGQVMFNGTDVTKLPPEERRIAQVFQFPVCYDSMNVFGNLAFPLVNDKMSADKIKKRVETVAEILELTDLLKSPMKKLTGAEKQKVALGRGIVRTNTAAVLLDEPLTVIDPKQQWGLRRKLREVQQELKLTMIYVTHDQHEALTFADQVTIMKGGSMVQQGSPEDLHANPESPFVGYFIGSPGMNVYDCKVDNGHFSFDGFSFPVCDNLKEKLNKADGDIKFGIRPEYIKVSKTEIRDSFSAEVLTIENIGAYKVLTLGKGSVKIKSRIEETEEISEGENLYVNFPQDKGILFHNDKRIC